MSIDRDDYFVQMMTSAWNLDGKKITKKGWGGDIGEDQCFTKKRQV